MDLETNLERLAPRLYRYALALAGDPGLAEEAAQDALYALVSRWRRHGQPRDVEAFAFTVTRRRLWRRRLRARAMAPIDALFDRHSDDPDPERRLLDGDHLRAVLGALDQLPARDREALVLVAGGELDLAAAAAVLGIRRGALKMRVHRARKRLSDLLEDDHGPSDTTRSALAEPG